MFVPVLCRPRTLVDRLPAALLPLRGPAFLTENPGSVHVAPSKPLFPLTTLLARVLYLPLSSPPTRSRDPKKYARKATEETIGDAKARYLARKAARASSKRVLPTFDA